MLSKEQLLDEARQQKKALALMGRWRNALFVLTTCLLVLAVFGFRKSVVPGVVAAVLAALSFLLLLLVNLSIRNGHRNVERILDSIQ